MSTSKPASFNYRLEAFLISAAVLLLEISYTRVVSFKLFYYYTYLVLGLALLGLGAGGVAVAVSKRLKASSTDKVLSVSLLGGAVAVAGGYLAITPIKLNTLSIWAYNANSVSSIFWLGLICVLIFLGFIGPGIALATLFGRQPERINSLYFSDLVGAAISCAVVGTLNATWGPPATIMLAAFLFTVAAIRAHRRNSPKTLPALGAVAMAALALTIFAGSLPDQTLDGSKGYLMNGKSLYSSWSPIFRIDAQQLTPVVRELSHDGLPGSTVYRWDRTQSTLKSYDFEHDIRSLPFVALQGAPKQEVIIGAAGGHEILTSIYYGSKKIDAVELNPATFNLVRNQFADYDGHLAEYPGVNYMNADGRSFISRSHKSYDMIWYPAPDSYAASSAAQAGAFVLSESYLYTYNAVMAVTSHLSQDGIFVAQFGELYRNLPSRTARFTSNVRVALEHMGVKDVGSHIVVVTTPDTFATPEQSTIFVKKSPFTAEQVAAIRTTVTSSLHGRVDWAPGIDVAHGPIQQIVSDSPADLATFYANYRFDVKSVSDNNPYFYHFANFGKVLSDYSAPVTTIDREYAVGERVLVLLLLLTVILAAMFLLVPFFRIREEWRRLPKKGASAVYFAMLGFGFIFFEVTMIQLLNLFLGYPTYSLTVSLMSLLVFAGIGAFLSPRINQVRHATLIGASLLSALTVFYVWGLRPLTNGLLGWPLPGRIALAFILLAPLGLLLGTFMPRGIAQIAKLGDHDGEYVAWSWAINGFASVTGSVLATICAMQFGFQVVLFIALSFYLVAFASLSRFRSAD